MRNVFLLIASQTLLSAQVITTVAGTGFVFPNSVPSLNAPLGRIYGVASDAKGNVYAADVDNQVIVQIAPSGTLTVVAGNGLFGTSGDGGVATNATLSNPNEVTLDAAGNIYFSEYGRIRKVSGGIVTTIAGNGNGGYGGDGGPATSALVGNNVTGIAVDAAGTVYIAEQDICRVRKIAAGIISTAVGNGTCAFSGDGGPASNATINAPAGITLDSAGNLYIADQGNNRIREVSGGTITTVAGGAASSQNNSLGNVTAIALDSSGNLYVADAYDNRIYKVSGGLLTPFAGSGQLGLSGDGGPALAALINNPYGIAFDGLGNLYIADTKNARIRRVTAGGIMGPVAGNGGFKYAGDGGPATSASFNAPPGVAVDAAGNIYIADAVNNRIRKVSNGIVTTFAGNGVPNYTGDGGPATSASLNNPQAVAVDSTGNVYIADSSNNAVRKVSGGTISTVTGNGTGGFSGDGGPASAATVSFPSGLAFDSTGNLYIADVQNSRIRKISNGIITTVAGNGTSGYSGDNGPATSAEFYFNYYYFAGLAVDSAGNLYVADILNARVRKVTFVGSVASISTFAGNGLGDGGAPTGSGGSGDNGPAVNAGISDPQGVAVDPQGNVYISEGGGNRVRKVSNGIITTVAGTGSYSFSGDGGLATNAAINGPAGLALDSAGNLFVADTGNDRVREILKTAPSFQLSQSTVNSSAIAGGLAPAASVIKLVPSTTGLPYTTFASANWLSVNPPSGTMPAALQISVDPSQLTAGNYVSAISISAPNAIPSTQTVTVNLRVGPPVASGLLLSSQTLSFAVTQGANAETSTLTVLNQGSGTAGFTATASSNGNWLQVSPGSGSVTAASPASLSVTATPGSLTAGTYSGTITVASADTGQSLAISVTLAVAAAGPQILLSQSGMTFTAVAQGGTVLPQSLSILNVGAGTLSWTASVFTSPPASGWLGVSAASGTVNRPFLDVSTLQVSVDAGGLSPGTYYGQVQITSIGAANSPQVALVILIVLPPGSNPGPDVSPIGLVFTGVVGGANPLSQSIAIANVTANPITFGSSVAYPGADNWIQYRPTNATVLPNSPVQIDVQPDFSSLNAGANFAALTLAFDDGAIRTIGILAVLAPAGTATAARTSPRVAGCTPTKLLPEFTLVGYSSSVTAGYPAVVAAKIVDDCGVPLTQGSAVVSFTNGDPQLSLIGLQDGTWTNSWQPGAAAGNVSLTLRASSPALNITGTTQAASVGLQQAAQTPPTVSGGPLGAGTLAQGPFAPGDVMLIKGSGLADGVSGATATPLQNTLAGASLLIGSRNASLLYVDSGTIVGLVPATVPVNASQQVLLLRDNAYGTPVSVIIAPTHPAILTADGSGQGPGLIYKGANLANGSNPVAAGDSIVIYSTGLGATDSTGKASNPVTLSIGGLAAQVSYAGVALPQSYPPSGAPMLLGVVSGALGGLYQITATVPAGLPGGAVALTIGSAGQTSQSGVTLTATGSPSGGAVPSIASITNSATGQINDGKHGLSPNSFISVYASNLGTNPQGVQVLFNGKSAPVYAVTPSANQINLVLPSELPTSGTATVNVQNGAGLSSSVALTLAPDSAGVFRIPDATHPNSAAAQIANTTWDVLAASTAAFYNFPPCTGLPAIAACAQPAKPGDNIVLYFTGGGLATPNGNPSGQPIPTGSVAPVSGSPLYLTVQTPTLTIGGLPAPIQFCGITPGTEALYQLNTQVPAGVTPGDSVPIVLTFANSTDTVTIAIQSP